MKDATKNLRLLVIVHEASRSGAPLICLYFLRWLRRNINCPVDILLLHGGELESDFAEVGHIRKIPWYISKSWRMPSMLGWLMPRARLSLLRFIRHKLIRFITGDTRRSNQYDLVLCSSIGSIWSLPSVVAEDTPVVLWIHELEFAMHSVSQTTGMMGDCFRSAQGIVACSRAVRDNLVENYGVNAKNIDVIPTFIDPPDYSGSVPIDDIPENSFVVMAVAWLQWRKGPDLFFRMIRRLPSVIDGREVHAVWIGGDHGDGLLEEMCERANITGFGDRLHFTGHLKNPTPLLNRADVFVLTSREDPYPLVLIEAGLAELPIVAFSGTGGAEEFLADQTGILVPYGDSAAMAEAVESLLRDPQLASAYARRANEKAQLHLTDNAAGHMFDVCVVMASSRAPIGYY